MKYCNSTCNMYDADNGVCCAADEPYVPVKLDAECFFDAYDRDHPYIEPPQTNAGVILSNVNDLDCLTELIWCGNWYEVFVGMPEFDSKQELADWLRQPKGEK